MKSSRLSIRDFSVAIALLVLGAFFALKEPEFLSARSLSQLMTELSIVATLAMGMLLIILGGHIDLSAGSGVGLLGGLASVLVMQHGYSAPAAMGISFVAGVVLWKAMGALIVMEKIPAFIVTLGGLLIFKGMFWRTIDNSTIPVTPGGTSNLYSLLTTYYVPPLWGLLLASVLVLILGLVTLRTRRQRLADGFEVESREMAFLKVFVAGQGMFLFVLVTNQFRGVPLPALILGLVTLIVHVLTRHTAFGRHLYAIGGNEEAAVVSGIPVKRVVFAAFGIMGGIVAITGFMQTAYVGSSTTTVGELMELDAVAACVVGGVSLRGGRGSVMGVLLGSLLMVTLLKGMGLMNVSPEHKFMARGIVLILAAWMDVRLNRR
jgi:D-xylose transport system permease protein